MAIQRRSIADLTAKIQSKIKTPAVREDEDTRFWELFRDKTGNGIATIRFLDNPEKNPMPYVSYHTHVFKIAYGDKKRWYWERCPNDLPHGKGENLCPVCENNSELFETGGKAGEDIARGRKRGLYYVASILVVDDPANPDNNGKVFLFKYGAQVQKIINTKIAPEVILGPNSEPLADKYQPKPVNVFDHETGLNFILKASAKPGFGCSYDKSEFETTATPVENFEEIYTQIYPLAEFVAETNYKPYAVLKDRFDWVTGIKDAVGAAEAQTRGGQVEPESEPVVEEAPKPKAKATTKPGAPNRTVTNSETEDYINELLAKK